MRFWQVIEEGQLRILIDRYNHFVVFDSERNLVCIFYVVGDEAAAVLVDGTLWGSRQADRPRGGPGAAERIGRALSAARRAPGEVVMTIRVPLGLKRQAASGLASALYFPSRDTALLFAVCARIPLDPSGRVFDLDGGFLVLLS